MEDGITMDPNNAIGQSPYLINKCPNGMVVHIICKSKIKSLIVDKIVANKKLFGMEYNRNDRNHAMEEA
jgi:hypothetical protein